MFSSLPPLVSVRLQGQPAERSFSYSILQPRLTRGLLSAGARGSAVKCTGRVHGARARDSRSACELSLRFSRGDRIAMAAGRVEEEGGTGICAGQIS